MQNDPKIRPNKSSAVNIPVISSSACWRLAQFLGHQLAGAALAELTSRSFYTLPGPCQGLYMTTSRRNTSVTRGLKADTGFQVRAQLV